MNGLRWRDAARDCGPHKTISNRFVRWPPRRIQRDFAELTGDAGKLERIMIDATHLNARD
jgi:hypothetical protein